MGSCLSKKSTSASSSCSVSLPNPPDKSKSEAPLEKKKIEEESTVKKEIFIIKHRKSHEIERQKSDEEEGEVKKGEEVVVKGKNSNGIIGGGGGGGAPVRTSSCTKEEVDAILIQCGRLSRSSSTGKAGLSSETGGRKYSGSKRSYDFDTENGNVANGDEDVVAKERENRRRERHRQSQGRRRTPSRERDQTGQQRSGSRERNGGRRVSRSPGRRSESPITTNSNSNSNPNSNSSAANSNSRPGKMVSVPATISSLAMDKSTNVAAAAGDPNSVAAVKRIQVKRNVGGERTAASPRARSPARVRASNENGGQIQPQQQPISLSRSNSRKAENSPYRRNPLGEIDNNIISQAPTQKPNADNKTLQGPENRINSSKLDSNQTNLNCKNQEEHLKTEDTKGPHGITSHVVLNVLSSGPETLKPNTVTRSRSSRLSRDLDITPETLANPNPSSYTALLLEDIQNFHQKNTPPPAAFSLPPCVTKACSILEAVADLNSATTTRNPIEQMNSKAKIRDPILESEVAGNDDLTQPSFHKYVTVRRGSATEGDDDDMEEQESSGSNSFVVSSSCWEPNSVESTDRWTSSSSSRSFSRQNDVSPLGFPRQSTKKKDAADYQQTGIGRGRIGTRGAHIAPAAAAST